MLRTTIQPQGTPESKMCHVAISIATCSHNAPVAFLPRASSKQEIASDKPEQPRPGPPKVPTPPSSRVSCNATKQKDFLKTLPTYSSQQLVPPHLRHTNPAGVVGAAGVLKGRLIRFQQL